MVRDVALAASGLLNPKVGGPSVFPPLPAFLFQPPVSYGPKVWPEATGAGPLPPGAVHVPLPLGARTRRCRRSTPPTATSPASAAARSNTPLQALTTLNEPVFLECAAALGVEGAGRGRQDRRANG